MIYHGCRRTRSLHSGAPNRQKSDVLTCITVHGRVWWTGVLAEREAIASRLFCVVIIIYSRRTCRSCHGLYHGFSIYFVRMRDRESKSVSRHVNEWPQSGGSAWLLPFSGAGDGLSTNPGTGILVRYAKAIGFVAYRRNRARYSERGANQCTTIM